LPSFHEATLEQAPICVKQAKKAGKPAFSFNIFTGNQIPASAGMTDAAG